MLRVMVFVGVFLAAEEVDCSVAIRPSQIPCACNFESKSMAERIEATCGDCGARLAVPDAVAGKKIRCPKCQGVVNVPNRTAQSSGATPASITPPSSPPAKSKQSPDRGRPKPARQKKRREPEAEIEEYDSYDNTSLEAAADPFGDSYSYASSALPPRKKKKQAAASVPEHNPYSSYSAPLESRMSMVGDDDLTGGDIAICVICGNVGCIVGIYRLCTGRSSSGLKMLLLSIFSQVFFGGISGMVLRAILSGAGR